MHQRAEALATRLAMLEKQEQRVKAQTNQTQRHLKELAVKKEWHEQRIHDKVEELREMHRADPFYKHETTKGPKDPEGGALPQPESSTQVDALPQLTSRSAGQEEQPQTATPKKLSSQAPLTPREPRAGGAVTHSGLPDSQAGTNTSRLHTSDILQNRYATLAAQREKANVARTKPRIGAYSFNGNRMWIEPGRVELSPPKTREPPTIPESLAKMDTKELVDKMTKKEIEIKERLDAARKAQTAANIDLASRLKSFESMQASARKAIREGVY